mgnify:CR=1 FL=1
MVNNLHTIMSPGSAALRRLKLVAAAGLMAFAAACASPSSESVYQGSEVGRQTNVQFGQVVSSRPIEVQGEPTGFGGIVGGVLGGIGGSGIGGGTGRDLAAAGGAALGALLGNYAEQQISNRQGVEYLIVLENGRSVTVSQTLNSGDPVFQPGTRVVVQESRGYQRVLNANAFPTTVQRPQGITVVD